jgi:hypothetical protein
MKFLLCISVLHETLNTKFFLLFSFENLVVTSSCDIVIFHKFLIYLLGNSIPQPDNQGEELYEDIKNRSYINIYKNILVKKEENIKQLQNKIGHLTSQTVV